MAPQIPTFIASGKAAVERYPENIPAEDFSGLAATGGQLQRTGQELGQIAGNLDYLNQRAKNEAIKNEFKIGKADYDAAIKNAALEINQDPLIVDAERAQKAFIFREKQIRDNLLSKMSGPEARGLLGQHIRESYGGNLVDIKTLGVKKAGDYAVSQLDKLESSTINNASQAVSLEQFDESINDYVNSATSMRDEGLITAKQYEDRKIEIRDKSFAARADVLINRDPELFQLAVQRGDFNDMQRDKLAAKLEKADGEKHQRQVRIDQETTKIKQKTEELWGVLAMQERLPKEWIADARAGRNPFMVDPDKILKYEKMNLNPPNATLDNTVRALRESYRAEFVTAPSEDVINKYRDRALDLRTDNPNNELSVLLNELASDRGQLRGIQAQGFQRVHRTLVGEKDSLERRKLGLAQVDAMFGKFDQNDKNELDRAAYDAWKRTGSPDEMEKAVLDKAKEIHDRRDARRKSKTPQQQNDDVIYGNRD